MRKYNKVYIGLLVGLILPFIVLFLVLLVSGYWDKVIHLPHNLPALKFVMLFFRLCLIANLLFFFPITSTKAHKNNFLRGILAATMLYAVGVAIVHFL